MVLGPGEYRASEGDSRDANALDVRAAITGRGYSEGRLVAGGVFDFAGSGY